MTAMAQAFSAALLDFVWQGLLAAFLLWAALLLLRNRSARARYLAGCVALAVMAALPVITACVVYRAPSAQPALVPSGSLAPAAIRAAVHAAAGSSVDWAAALERWALLAWSAGVLLCSLRLVWAARRISLLRRRATLPAAAVRAAIAALQERLRLARPVRVLVSTMADCPSVVGWLRPVVLLPAATLAGLTPQQLEAVLAHEFAHILRYDHLVNMLQTVVETLLFYHPAIWWASARIRHERELCCDDLAVDACGDALCYARALTRLERLRMPPARLALGSTGGSLMFRIRRLVGDAAAQSGPSKLPGILALSLGLVCLALNMQWARGQQSQPAPEPAVTGTNAIDDPGVRVDLGGAAVIHRDPVEYPAAAREKGVQGTVVVEATMDAAGVVNDARVLSGPPELRKAALESVLQWHFTHDAAGGARQIGITFQTPPAGAVVRHSEDRARHKAELRAVAEAARERATAGSLMNKQAAEDLEREMREFRAQQHAAGADAELQAKRMAELTLLARKMQRDRQQAAEDTDLDQVRELENQLRVLQSQQGALTDEHNAGIAELEKRLAESRAALNSLQVQGPMFAGRRLKSITIQGDGLPRASRDELLSQLPVHVGDVLAEDSYERIEAAVKRFDEHLGLSMFTTHDGQVEIRITPPHSDDLRQ